MPDHFYHCCRRALLSGIASINVTFATDELVLGVVAVERQDDYSALPEGTQQ